MVAATATAAECPCAIAHTAPTVPVSLRVPPEVLAELGALVEALGASDHPGPWSRARAGALALRRGLAALKAELGAEPEEPKVAPIMVRLEALAERVEEATP